MQITFLGGANEIGASSTLLTIGGRRLLIDSGVRQGRSARGPLPDLDRLREEGGIDAVLVTHAHLDHTGSLPLVHQAFPHARVITTAPTRDILSILLKDAIRVMHAQSEREEQLPLYGAREVEHLLQAIVSVRFGQPESLAEGLRATFFPAGHILGAACIGIESEREGRILITGDYSVGPQATVHGMPPPPFRPHVVVTESTYGERQHADRVSQEQRLVQQVADTIGNGGKVLIPAFALGRAQEVLLILRRAIAKKQLEAIPVHADGMVRGVCGVYQKYPYYLNTPLQKRARKGALFFSETGPIQPVRSAEQRKEIVAGGPCCVVASSGMLSGGASTYYAEHFAGHEENLIAITGYQDEESPGRSLLDLAEGQARTISMQGRTLEVRCRVDKYHLSAHADQSEIVSLLTRLKPREVVFVHGSLEPRQALARSVGSALRCRTYLPDTGDTISILGEASRAAGTPPRAAAIGAGEPLTDDKLRRLYDEIAANAPARGLELPELLQIWYGNREFSEQDWSSAADLLAGSRLFEPDRRRPFVFRPIDRERLQKIEARQEGPLDQARALEAVDALLPQDCGLYQRGAETTTRTITLRFRFPVQAANLQEVFDRIEADTGWSLKVHPFPHAGALVDEVRGLLGESVRLAGEPSIRLETGEVVARLDGEQQEPPIDSRGFFKTTGFRLVLKRHARTPQARERFGADGRMEINETYRRIEAAFAGQRDRPYKRGKKLGPDGPFVEVAFLTPAVGERQRELLDQLEQDTGWTIAISRQPDQNGLAAKARRELPEQLALRREPSIDRAACKLRLQLEGTVEDSVWKRFTSDFESETGYQVERV